MNIYQKNELLVRAATALVPLFLILCWQIASLMLGQMVLPRPWNVLSIMVRGLTLHGWLLSGLKATMTELVLGYLLAVICGLGLGFWFGLNRFSGEVAEPFVLNIYAIPKVTLFPIFLFLFGLGLSSKIAFGFFHGVFPIIILTMSGIKDIKPVYLKVGRSFRLMPWALFREIVLPAILPSLMTGLRLGFNLCFIGVILGEMAASQSGLGYTLMRSEAVFYMQKILAIVVLLAVIAICVNMAFYSLEDRLSPRGSRKADQVGVTH